MGSLVVKDNALIEASHKLGETEQRLILLAILEGRRECNTVEQLQGKELTIHAEDYAKTFGISRQMAYKALRESVIGLYRAEWGYKYLTEKGEQRVRYERFTQSADYGEGSGAVKFMFSNAIIPMLVELEKRFTVYEIEQVAQLSSGYSIRLYEFFMQYFDKEVGKGWFEISLDDLRFRFGLLPTEYARMGDFKKGVLDLAIQQINNSTNLKASYEQRKRGRNIIGFRFNFKVKSNKKSKNKYLESKDNNTPAPIKYKEIQKEEEQQRIAIMIAKFESLPCDEREHILDEVATHINGPFENLYKQARARGVAHKDKIFIYWFLEILDC